jgi:hypothetical protein
MLTGHTPLFFKIKTMTFLDKIKERHFKKSQNTNIAFTGENKSGKSYSGLKYTRLFTDEITHTPFHIVFTYEEFFKLAETPDINNCVIIFDEVGSESRSERHWEVESQNLGEILELWGMKKCILLLTLPNWSKLTSGVKGMIHFRASCYINIVEDKPEYLVSILRKFESWKKGKEIFIPFKTLTIDRDAETDKLYEQYYPMKVNNYNEKMQEMKERFLRKGHKTYQKPIIDLLELPSDLEVSG